MTVLVTGSTGAVGSIAVRHLVAAGTQVRALTRSPERAHFPDGVVPVQGEFTDPAVLRAALEGVSGLFLLSPVALEELTGTLHTLTLAHAAGVRDVVYLSVIHADRFTDPPHFAAKAAAERLIADLGITATVLRPGYYMQNDAAEKDRLLAGTYAPPVGNRSALMVDVRDLGEVAAAALLERQHADQAMPTEVIDVVDPEVLTGDGLARMWAEVLGREVSYGGDDVLDGLEQQLTAFMPGWMAYDMRLMMRRFQVDGMHAAPGTEQRLRALLGRPMRSYRDFATETAATWPN
jgi:uncharacterized protein YbjT (DUF2867 family)